MNGVKYELVGTSNPGWNFTDTRIEQIYNMYKIIKRIDEDIDYRSLQEKIVSYDFDLNGSKIRMFFPHLRQLGFIGEYQNMKFRPSELFTDVGKIFFGYIIPIYLNKELFNKKIQNKIDDLFSLYLCKGYINLIKDNENRVYKLIMEFVKKIHVIDKTDFFIITTGVVKKQSFEEIYNILMSKKNNILNFDDKVSKNVNSYGYIVPFLEQAKLIVVKDDKIRLGCNSNYIWR